MNRIVSMFLSAGFGIAVGVLGYHLLQANTAEPAQSSEQDQPLYWVAPMDPNYRRDGPGKSPMGMDLVPVYAEQGDQADSPGTIKISPEVENNLAVRTATVERKRLSDTITTVGYVGFNQDTLIHIHPRVEGWLETLNIKVAGERVEKGTPLFSLYSPELVNAQKELLLTLDKVDPALIEAAKERLRALHVPERQINQVIKTGKASQTVTIYAPQTGIVEMLEVSEGYFVQPGDTILSLGPLNEVWVTAEVFERQANLVKIGDPVTMTLDYLPGRNWQGVVDYIYPALEPTNRTAQVRLRFANPDETLKPNMFAQISIHTQSTGEQLVVPTEAVIRTGHQDRLVLALGDGKFKSVAVDLGRVNQHQAEIIGGVEAGDQIVTSAQFLLDSESSISSDFSRMSIYQEAKPVSAWAEGVVTSVDRSRRTATVDHQAVEAWQMPAMVMDFVVAEAVDLSQLKPGVRMHFEMTEIEQGFSITAIHVMGMDHSQHKNMDHSQHKNMDHSQHKNMDHSQHKNMDHSQHKNMDHSQHKNMDHSQHKNMDHSQHKNMDHSQHKNMDHSQHKNMDHSQHKNMDHSQHKNMDHSQHKNMDHSQHKNMDHSQHKNMDHSQHKNMDHSQHHGDQK
ncbi:efflux RND transporter periplasmic adaptor subunit [Neiella sp. HB171785]|uniref:Efflux RND transporter periplasmic adaptor subunit n=1 Tax=Neiella litorisoli TaxID=2771431 RepID=A0A8J6QV71_9GAMM|nr:efflux RND transporter periplasmic adaptor subunit [Neiella litorisoli]MBD1390982.1 efflux RND transporter periplasmic adaptor subunit [Neiella litorisoli]